MRITMATILVFLVCGALAAEHPQKQRLSPAGVNGLPAATLLDINRVAAWYLANGIQEQHPNPNSSGLFYPIGTYANAVYTAGIIWSSKYFNDGRTPILRTNGQSYNKGTKPGAILGIRTGTVEDPNSPGVRIWRIRRDYRTADLNQDAAYSNNVALNDVTGAMVDSLRAQYDRDWREWPAAKGAPFYDHDGDGIYTPQFDTAGNPTLYPDADEPGYANGDQVIWLVCNDVGVTEPWACPETGIEEQMTIWGYQQTNALANVIFKRYRLIYKGVAATPPDARIDNMYVSQWSDPDIGNGRDDFAGCDTLLNLGYAYNGGPNDNVYAANGLAPPAAGYVLLQGPIVAGAPTDSAIYDLKWVRAKRNLPMTSFIFFAAGGRYSDPPFSYSGAILWNDMLRGLPPVSSLIIDPDPFIDPVTRKPTYFWLSGDPVSHTGWTDGSLDPPGDRRIVMSSGPFTMALGDTQEFVTAWVGGLGSNYLSSVSVMKYNASFALETYTLMAVPTAVADERPPLPLKFSVSQCYPNPFNPSTTIAYELVESGPVTLKVYDILGREVATLVNTIEKPGHRSVRFDGTGLASGVYLYRLTAGGLSQTRNMLLVR